ncbi:hypothetical protein [Mesorhizobium sp. ANAO-SY3R2]
MSSVESAPLWGTDRQNLGECAARNRVLVTAIEALEKQGGGPHSRGGAE